LSDMRPCWNF